MLFGHGLRVLRAVWKAEAANVFLLDVAHNLRRVDKTGRVPVVQHEKLEKFLVLTPRVLGPRLHNYELTFSIRFVLRASTQHPKSVDDHTLSSDVYFRTHCFRPGAGLRDPNLSERARPFRVCRVFR